MTIAKEVEPKVEAKKEDFPLEIRVFFNSKGKRYAVSSYGGWIETEKADPDFLAKFDTAPQTVRFGDEYQKVSDEKIEGGIRRVTYKNKTVY